MSETQEHNHEENKESPAGQTRFKPLLKWGGLALLVVVIIAGILVFFETKNPWGDKATEVAENNLVPVVTPTPTAIAQVGGEQVTSSGNIVPSEQVEPRGSVGGVPSIADAVATYKSTLLGFESEVNAEWQANELPHKNEVVFINQHGQLYSIQSLQNNGQTLGDIQVQLSGSPSVWGIEQTTFEGVQALRFNMGGQFRQGIVVISGGHLFYIMGPDLTGGPLAKFSFI